MLSMPDKECDLVMKGGVTSGIVYPSFVLKLKDNYKFRSVGGTSAGAIAAAATAAAEFGRHSKGFESLENLRDQLSKDTFLRDLFQPSTKTAPLFFFLLDFMELVKGKNGVKEKVKLALTLLPSHFLMATILGAILGLLSAFLITGLLGGSNLLGFVVFAVVLAIVGSMIGAGFHVWLIVTKEIPKNYFGICTGRLEDPNKHSEEEVLTVWLDNQINTMAGLQQGRALLFSDLKNKPFDDERDKEKGKEPNIDLRMVTSNLSQNQPYVLPFEKHPFIFREKDFRDFFPDYVVKYMTDTAFEDEEHQRKLSKNKLPSGYYFLPESNDLPVIVATRMSLSFPLLLSAVPLYTIKPEKAHGNEDNPDPISIDESDLQKHWFSDGGISSNFPIHFFDGWLPSRPTFGANLVPLPKEQVQGDKVVKEYISFASDPLANGPHIGTRTKSQVDAVYLPKANEDVATEWIPFETKSDREGQPVRHLSRFLFAIFNTAQNYRDNTQAMLPSYRERIVQIRLSEDEGGLNLAMPKHTINNVIEKGQEAGQVILSNFDFPIHSWVRFLVMMKQMEKGINDLKMVIGNADFYKELCKERKIPEGFPYQKDEEWIKDAVARILLLGGIIATWNKMIFQENSPIPEPVLRVTPEL